MKQKLLSTLLGFLVLTGFSQNLDLKFDGMKIDPGEEITLVAHADSGMMVFEGLLIKNTGTELKLIKIAREIITQVANTENSFYWGTGYSADTDTSTLSVKIEGGEISTDFVGYYIPNGNIGTTSVKYTLFELGDPDETTYFFVNYKTVDELAVPENRELYFSPIYPNPANNQANLDYQIHGTNAEVKFILINLLGKKVKEIEISENNGSLQLNTSGLTEGIYFYSLLINNESVLTQKLIIKH